ncbi:DUF2982 domain-containing protein [Veronia nyctiphanis]|nr:DUF2982 domain-containing protein [Veronia nyctiphanis]
MSRALHIFHRQGQRSRTLSAVIVTVCIAALLFVLTNPEISFATGLIVILLVTALATYLIHTLNQSNLAFSFSQMHLQHHTQKGGWSVRWTDISEVGVPSISKEGWNHPLPWMGIRIKDYGAFLDSISFRLASGIIMEQRGLLLSAYRFREEDSKKEIEDMIFDDKPYVSADGKEYHGLVAMLANRMVYTRTLLGYDIFVSEDFLDRPLNDFVGLTRRYLAASAGLDSIPEDEVERLKALATHQQRMD